MVLDSFRKRENKDLPGMSCRVPFLSHFIEWSLLRLPKLAMSTNKSSSIVSDESLDHVFLLWILILFDFLTTTRKIALWYQPVCHFFCNSRLQTQN